MKAKYLAILPVLAFAFALTTAAAFADRGRYDDRDNHHSDGPVVEVDNENDADVHNNVDSSSNTGNNNADRNGRIGRITTGDAFADSLANTTANGNTTRINVQRFDKVEVDNENDADVDNNVGAGANTGYNNANDNGGMTMVPDRSRDHHHVVYMESNGRGVIATGMASSISTAVNMLNTNLTSIR